MNANAWNRLTAPILRRIRMLVTRGVVKLVDPAQLTQLLQVELLSGEVLDSVEHFEPYGLTARPHAGAEAVVLSAAGRRAGAVVISVHDRRYRLTGLNEGEVALYDDLGQKVHLKRTGIAVETALAVDVKAGGKATIEANGTVEIKGATGAAVKGLVQGDCLCAFTGQPHPMVSATVKGST